MNDFTSPSSTGVPPGLGRAFDQALRATNGVGAYRSFLADHGVDVAAIRSMADFTALPVVTADNYLRRYPLSELMWDSDIRSATEWNTSSGSTGEPSYYPMNSVSAEHGIELYDRIFRTGFQSDRVSTLLVVGFAMGTWVGGTYTYRAALELCRRGHELAAITPGVACSSILKSIAQLGNYYDQVVLAGYPPFVRDVLDEANGEVPHPNMRILAAGESVTEPWRDRILELIGHPGAAERVRLIYGTADAGIIGYETADAIAVRRLAHADQRLRSVLFGAGDVLPTFVEFDPQLRFTEVDRDGRFLFTIDGPIPLTRYRLNDEGAILTRDEVSDALRRCGYQLPVRTSTRDSGFLMLRRRSDVAASFYGVKLYPESIRSALDDPAVSSHLSGKFTLTTELDADFAQTLTLCVELRRGATPPADLLETVARRVVVALAATSSEYHRLHAELGSRAEPSVSLKPFGHKLFRTESIKTRYVGASDEN
ncbi:phenylacetate--CoA ligase family protein [Nocardia terpenica]|uniref:Phenylacetate--CoA ligase family protein n=1 Tax=Nocardia terpenica TaxID=455432 RepID=A0A6G9Z0H6_9NOCA|nr:phenylacetate--CoA ligase family protein [Nocardia terpenica]QIS18940.1 phenylacetate--CoA ligase family protein [Nocardia terpenica]